MKERHKLRPGAGYEEFDGYQEERSVRMSLRNVFKCALTDTATFGVDAFYAPKVNDFDDAQVFAVQLCGPAIFDAEFTVLGVDVFGHEINAIGA